jgi:predicted nuclease of restriction endonuclease-like (RecB) superfamily
MMSAFPMRKTFFRHFRNALALVQRRPSVQTRWKLGRMIAEEQFRYPLSRQNTFPRTLAAALNPTLAEELTRCRDFFLAFPHRTDIPPALEWGHFRELLRVKSLYARDYYTAEAAAAHWKVAELTRQIRTHAYDRLLLHRRALTGISPEWAPEAVLKDPYVFEFLPFEPGAAFSEKQLEDALMERLPRFLLELGSGFAFIARQKRVHARRNYFADLLFYHFLLRSFVIIDLKADPLSYADIGQMDLYIRLCEAHWRGPHDNPSIGIILCPEKNDALESYSLLNSNRQIFASNYVFRMSEVEGGRLKATHRVPH